MSRFTLKEYKQNYAKHIGKRFDYLTVMAVGDKILPPGGILLICKCECGRTKETFYRYLKTRLIKSCGQKDCKYTLKRQRFEDWAGNKKP